MPQFIVEQEGEGEWQPYRALRRLAASAASEGPTALLFRAKGGVPLTTARFRAIVKRSAHTLGMNPKVFGAHSARIGGATELMARGGASELLLEAKGRWDSQIARIYARMTRRAHIEASDAMFKGHGRDLEELFTSFTQPV